MPRTMEHVRGDISTNGMPSGLITNICLLDDLNLTPTDKPPISMVTQNTGFHTCIGGVNWSSWFLTLVRIQRHFIHLLQVTL